MDIGYRAAEASIDKSHIRFRRSRRLFLNLPLVALVGLLRWCFLSVG